MALWKQMIGVVLVLGLIAVAAVFTVPGVRGYLEAQGWLAAAATAEAAATPGAPAASAAPAAQGARSGRPPRSNLVVLVPVNSAMANERVAALGIAQAANSIMLVAEASGRVVDLPVTSGQRVSAGDIVARLDSDAEQIAYDSAKVEADDAQMTLERNMQLNEGKLLLASEMQAYDLAAKMANLKLRAAELDLKNRTLVAPFDGTLGILQTSVGADVTAQAPIAPLVDDRALTIRFSVPERMLGAVQQGDKVTLLPVASPQDQYEGDVSVVDNTVNSTTGSFDVEATLPNLDGKLRAGMGFSVNIAVPGQSFASIPPLAVQWGSNGSYLWRVTDNVASRVEIRIVQRNSEAVLVAGELADGDMVVTEGLDGLKEGATVQVFGQPPQAPASEASAAPAAPASAQTAAAVDGTIRFKQAEKPGAPATKVEN